MCYPDTSKQRELIGYKNRLTLTFSVEARFSDALLREEILERREFRSRPASSSSKSNISFFTVGCAAVASRLAFPDKSIEAATIPRKRPVY